MKKTIIVLMLHSIPFILFSIEDTDADSVRFRSNLSVSLSYSPYFALFSNSSEPLTSDYKFYANGISLSIEFKKVNERVGISSGVTYRIKNIKHSTSTESITLWEVPIQIKYYFIKAESRIYPYVAPAIKICQFKSSYDPHISLSEPFHDYLPIIDLGIGTYFNVFSNIYGVFESNFGYGITGILPHRSYLDFKVGLTIKFNSNS